MLGKIPDFLSGSLRRPPSRIDSRVAKMTSLITTLPAVAATVSSACMIGTPDLTSVPRVRVNLATATFFRMGPKTGRFSAFPSHQCWPYGVL